MISLYFKETGNNKIEQMTVVKPGQRYEISAEAGEIYNLIDPDTGNTVTDIAAERIGDDLHLYSEANRIEVVIKEFWNGECVPGESQCFAVLDVPCGVDGLLGQSTITQEGPILDHLLAGEIGTLADNGIIAYLPSSIIGLIGAGATLIGGILINQNHDDNDVVSVRTPPKPSIRIGKGNEYIRACP